MPRAVPARRAPAGLGQRAARAAHAVLAARLRGAHRLPHRRHAGVDLSTRPAAPARQRGVVVLGTEGSCRKPGGKRCNTVFWLDPNVFEPD